MPKKLINSNIIEDDFTHLLTSFRNWNFLKNTRFLITGSTGFIASYFVNFLNHISKENNLKIQIDCLVRSKVKAKQKFFDLTAKSNINVIKADINRPITLKQDYDFILHAASIASPKFFSSNPIETILPNSLGTMNLLKFAEKNKNLKRFIFFSTTGVNGFLDDSLRPVNENTYGPINHQEIQNSYLESKKFGETLCVSWHKQYKIPINIVRPAITYGPGIDLDDDRSYSYFIKCVVNNQNIKLTSDGKAIRNFCYIADFIRGLLYVIKKGKIGETYNICTEHETTIKDLTNLLCNKLVKHKKIKVMFSKEKFKRINFNKTTVSTKKLRDLGWVEHYNVETGFKRTIDYYEKTN